METQYKDLTIHQKLEILVNELVDKELPIRDVLNEFKKIYIKAAASRYNGNKTRMAKALNIHRNTLHNMTKALKI